MPAVRAFDHVGITVSDLDAATAFFVGLGLEVEGRTFVEGDFLDTVIGMHGARTEIVMLRAPGGGTAVELSSFISPDHDPGPQAAMANEIGLRSVAFEVSDIGDVVDRLAADGYGLVGGIGSTRTCGAWRTCGDPTGSSSPLPSGSADPPTVTVRVRRTNSMKKRRGRHARRAQSSAWRTRGRPRRFPRSRSTSGSSRS